MNKVKKRRGRKRNVTDEQIRQMRAYAAAGKNYIEISKLMGLNKGQVYYWLGMAAIKPKAIE